MIVFGIYFNFFIILPIQLKTGSYNGFLVNGFLSSKNRVRLRGFARPSAPDSDPDANLSRYEC